MKKYLMTGAAALALAFVNVGCSSDSESVTLNKEQQYKAVFENEFGKVDPNQTWGFGEKATRGEWVNRNQWGEFESQGKVSGEQSYLSIPKNVTQQEQALVVAEFSKKRVGATNTIQINWTDFFVTQVYDGANTYTDKSGASFTTSSNMNQLCVRKAEGGISSTGAFEPASAWEHVNDYNNGMQTSNFGKIEGHTFMANSGTMEFAYHNVKDSKYHNEYIIIPGADIDESLAGYYYIGFDFYAHGTDMYPANTNMDVDRDWVFNDWIVRISPGEFAGQKRIYVEDLISGSLKNVDKSDWDFNDAVFDAFVYYNPNWRDGSFAVITLRAAGGTLPLTIAGREVHELFGVSQTTMVNTGVGADVPPVQFRIPGNQLTSGDANDIKVIVTNAEGEKIELRAEKGEATQKFAVPAGEHVKWMKERQHISTGYENFSQYVKDASIVEWWTPAVETPLFQKYY